MDRRRRPLVSVGALCVAVCGLLAIHVFGQALPSPPVGALPPDTEKPRRERAQAEEMEARIHTPWNVCVDLQMVSVDEATALKLIPALQSREAKTVAAAWDRLQAMLKAREATLLAWPMVRTVDGASGVSETVLEKRYATEFEPPRAPGDRGIKKPGSVNAATVDGLPLAFETRNLGVVLEVEPLVLDEGKRIYLRLVPLRTELLKMEEDRHVFDYPKHSRHRPPAPAGGS